MSRTSRTAVVALLLVLCAGPLVATSNASRRATSSEARAIRAAVLRSLDGSGWRVSSIRVASVRSTYRYAKATVSHRRTGVGGLMILRRKRMRWSRVYLGTDGFCRAKAPRNVLRNLGFRCSDPKARLTITPASARPGGTLVFAGRTFRGNRTVTLSAGPAASEGDRIGTVRASRYGRFRIRITLSTSAVPGTYVAVACQSDCTRKATARFRIDAP
ncbi:hypothetical protein [Paraconexibacter sp.]|uniref:hypothetical protein n=1 Tax=Paraconexibacter sp. TaxID=2949640 RepID=UPI00356566A8